MLGLISKLRGKSNKEKNPETSPITFALENESDANGIFSSTGNLYDNDITRAAIWTNAKNAGKLNPKHIRKTTGKYEVFPVPRIERVLTRPNPYMSMSVFINKMVTTCFKNNNAFALIKFGDDGYPEMILPINYKKAEAIESGGFYFVKFYFIHGKTMTVPYEELIHLRMHIDSKEIFGESNKRPLENILEVINTTDKGVINAIKKSAIIRWLIKFNTTLRPEDKEREINDFVKKYLSIENSGGAAATDPRYEATQVKPESYIPEAAQMKNSKERIFSYFGTNEDIIQSKFSEDNWNAYYENTIEPIAVQLSEEFTEKLFSQKERDFGNSIVFESNRLQYASNRTKILVGKFLCEIGAGTLDQILEIFNMTPIGGEEGSRRVQTLNMVNAALADEYQLGEEDSTKNNEKGENSN